MNIGSFANEVRSFIQQHQTLCLLTLGLAIVGFSVINLAGRSISWILHCFETTKKVDNLGRSILTNEQTFNLESPPLRPFHPTENTEPKLTFSLEKKEFLLAFEKTPPFTGYNIALPEGHPGTGVVLTGVSLRPSNLFFAELFKNSNIKTTLPGKGQLFAFTTPQQKVREYLEQLLKDNPKGIVSFSAQGMPGQIIVEKKLLNIENLSEIFGNHTYRISYQEILDILESQKIFTSSLLPLPFYSGLKKAMKADQIVTLPEIDSNPVLLGELKEKKEIGYFLATVEKNPEDFGFTSLEDFNKFLTLTLYQIGSMVVKTEDYHLLMDGEGKMMAREADQNDAIRLINACGIRGITSKKTPQKVNKQIMTETFKTALIAAASGIVVFPAVGMGVWRGDPDLYWRAFFDALVESQNNIEQIFVNPGHQASAYGKYKGCCGEEFQQILEEYLTKYQEDEKTMHKLNKIFNLHDSKKDLLQLAYSLKKAFPHLIVSIFNASDPDVTFGYHVGEYVNNFPHTYTTEENYTAMGTNGLCFEGITRIHDFTNRLIQT